MYAEQLEVHDESDTLAASYDHVATTDNNSRELIYSIDESLLGPIKGPKGKSIGNLRREFPNVEIQIIEKRNEEEVSIRGNEEQCRKVLARLMTIVSNDLYLNQAAREVNFPKSKSFILYQCTFIKRNPSFVLPCMYLCFYFILLASDEHSCL